MRRVEDELLIDPAARLRTSGADHLQALRRWTRPSSGRTLLEQEFAELQRRIGELEEAEIGAVLPEDG